MGRVILNPTPVFGVVTLMNSYEGSSVEYDTRTIRGRVAVGILEAIGLHARVPSILSSKYIQRGELRCEWKLHTLLSHSHDGRFGVLSASIGVAASDHTRINRRPGAELKDPEGALLKRGAAWLEI